MKSDSLGYYNVEYDEDTGEIIFDPRAPKIIVPEIVEKPKTIADVKAMAKGK